MSDFDANRFKPGTARAFVGAAAEIPSMAFKGQAIRVFDENNTEWLWRDGAYQMGGGGASENDLAAVTASVSSIASAVSALQAGVGQTLQPVVVNESTTNHTLVAANFDGAQLRTNSGTANTITCPTPQSLGLAVGKKLEVMQAGIGATRFVPGSGAQILPSGVDQIEGQMRVAVLEVFSPTSWALHGEVDTSGQPTVTVQAAITGSGVVGVQLTGVDPTFVGGGAITARQWLRSGAVIASGANYTPVGGDVTNPPSPLQFQAVITKAGFSPVVSTSLPIYAVASGETKPQNVSPPYIEAIDGNREGDTIRLHVGTWTNTPVGTPGYTIYLKRGSTTIATYTLSAATLYQDYDIAALDVSQQLTIEVRATNAAGTITPGATSQPFQVAGPKPVYNGGAAITPASPVVGDLLTASSGSVSGSGVTLTPTWHYVGGSALPAQSPANQYQTHGAIAGNPPVPTDAGRQMFVRWTATNAGGSITFDTPNVTIAASGGGSGTATNNGIPHGGAQIFPVAGGPTTLAVGHRPWGIHVTKYTKDYGGSTERQCYPLNTSPKSFRVYGCHKLMWNFVDPSANGSRNWTEWDLAAADWAAAGVASVTYNLHGVPAGYRLQPEPTTGEWGMQLTNVAAMKAWLTDLCNRYHIIDYVEVANEFWTGAYPGVFWGGSRADLMTLCNQVLDWRAEYLAATGRYIRIQAPSTPGTVGHANEQLSFFDDYQAAYPGRPAQFDSFSIHLYGTTEADVHFATWGGGSGLQTLRNGLNARSWGLNKEIRDGEHGFYDPNVPPHQPHNLVLRELVNGCSGCDFFFYGETGSSGDTHLGQPDINAGVRAGYEMLGQYANTTITRITAGALGTYWAVDYITDGAPPAPPPGPPPPPPPPPSGSAPTFYAARFTPEPDGSTQANSATAVGTLPSGVQNGERLLMAVSTIDLSITHTTPAGWSLEGSTTAGSGATGVRTSIYSRVASSEPPSYNVTLSGSAAWLVGVVRASAATLDAAPAGIGGTPSGSPSGVTHTGMSTNGTNRLLVAIAAQFAPGGTTWQSPPAVDIPAGWTPALAIWHQHGPNMAVIYREQPAAGATGSFKFGCDGDSSNATVVQLIALKT